MIGCYVVSDVFYVIDIFHKFSTNVIYNTSKALAVFQTSGQSAAKSHIITDHWPVPITRPHQSQLL